MQKNIKKLPSLSVFFPTYNEEKNLPLLIKEARQVFPTVAEKYEIIIVNDGSKDKTKQIAEKLAKKYKDVRVVNHKKNKGYGAALKTGFKKAKYEWIFFSDSDLQFKLSQISKLVKFADQSQVVIGYRKKRAEGSIRAFNAKLFKLYVDILFRIGVKDIDCAFKLLHKNTIKPLKLVSSSAFTTSEFLYKMKKNGVEFIQVGVNHRKRKYGTPTGNNISVIIKAGFEALSLYLTIKFTALRIEWLLPSQLKYTH